MRVYDQIRATVSPVRSTARSCSGGRFLMADPAFSVARTDSKYRGVVEVGGKVRGYAVFRVNDEWANRGPTKTVDGPRGRTRSTPRPSSISGSGSGRWTSPRTSRRGADPCPHPLQLRLLRAASTRADGRRRPVAALRRRRRGARRAVVRGGGERRPGADRRLRARERRSMAARVRADGAGHGQAHDPEAGSARWTSRRWRASTSARGGSRTWRPRVASPSTGRARSVPRTCSSRRSGRRSQHDVLAGDRYGRLAGQDPEDREGAPRTRPGPPHSERLGSPHCPTPEGPIGVQLFELYRYAKPSPGAHVEFIDGYRNIFNATRWPDWPGLRDAGRVQLDQGIGSVKRVHAVDGDRRPAILIASKPHQAGSDWTPWHDELDAERGHIRYFGDNKADFAKDALGPRGNRSVVEQFALHTSASREDRLRAAPMLFFESLVFEGKAKGYWRFLGVGLVERAELVTQVDRRGRPFVNYVFDCLLVDLSSEGLGVAWEWIAARRDPTKSLEECLLLAPASWRRWVEGGGAMKERVRQHMRRAATLSPADQRPAAGSPADDALRRVIMRYKRTGNYQGVGEHRFEGLASEVTGSVLGESGQYRPGWITKRAGDGGIDFVSRLDLGSGASSLKLVVLGQAKCIAGVAPVTSGLDLARTVARLDRGWVGSFVTTGYFSEQAQREVVSDRFPLLMLNGRHVGETVVRESSLRGVSIDEYISQVDAEYDARVSSRLPAEILAE